MTKDRQTDTQYPALRGVYPGYLLRTSLLNNEQIIPFRQSFFRLSKRSIKLISTIAQHRRETIRFDAAVDTKQIQLKNA